MFYNGSPKFRPKNKPSEFLKLCKIWYASLNRFQLSKKIFVVSPKSTLEVVHPILPESQIFNMIDFKRCTARRVSFIM